MSIIKLDSQHFWDQMDALPSAAIPHIEEEIVYTLIERQWVSLDTLLCDTTNFFTYIHSTNTQNTLTERGKNKQKRMDLRQFGLLLLISRQDYMPLFHKLYQGNLSDKTVFKDQFKNILDRFKAISGSLEDLTLVFDQGYNSKERLEQVDKEIFFVGALSPHHHRSLIEEANRSMQQMVVKGDKIDCYRTRTTIWQLDLTMVVYISEKLLQGQIRGIEQNFEKLYKKLNEIKEQIHLPTQRGRKRERAVLEKKIKSFISAYQLSDLVEWELLSKEKDSFELHFWIDQERLDHLKRNWLGRRILVTNRHCWSSQEILLAYWGQANIEYAFKNLKNPFHMAVRPQYHWTDQKIEVHAFTCVLAFLLTIVAYKRAKERIQYSGSPNTLLEKLSQIRLATFIESPTQKTKGKYKAIYCLEDMDEDIAEIAEAMGISNDIKKSKIPFSVYKY